MLNVNFTISNPFSKLKFNNLFNKSGMISENKAWEIDCYRLSVLFEVGLYLSMRDHHAGVSITLGLFGYALEASICDTRHWDSETDDWEKHDNS